MGIEIKIPTNMSEVTLARYQDFLSLVKESTDNEFVMHKTLEIFCDIQLKDTIRIKALDVLETVEKIANIFKEEPEFRSTFKIGDIEFGFIPKLEDMTWAEYMDLEKYIGDWSTYHKAMAVMYRPIKHKRKELYEIHEYTGTKEYADAMRFAPLDVVWSSALFFWNLERELYQAFLRFIEKSIQELTLVNGAKSPNLIKDGDGITQSIALLKEISLNSTRSRPSMSLQR
jgi:hypothetical protein